MIVVLQIQLHKNRRLRRVVIVFSDAVEYVLSLIHIYLYPWDFRRRRHRPRAGGQPPGGEGTGAQRDGKGAGLPGLPGAAVRCFSRGAARTSGHGNGLQNTETGRDDVRETIEKLLPGEIEARSFEIIARELGERTFPPEQEAEMCIRDRGVYPGAGGAVSLLLPRVCAGVWRHHGGSGGIFPPAGGARLSGGADRLKYLEVGV